MVHGGDVSTDTWNSLTKGDKVYTDNGRMGGSVWNEVGAILKEHGHRVWAPTLVNENVADLTGHVNQICEIITTNGLKDIVLVGHSYGGVVITGVADRLPDRIGRLVYLDASLPDPGQSLFDFLALSGIDPAVGIPGLEAAKAYVEKLHYDPENIKPIKKIFILCTGDSVITQFVAVAMAKIKASSDKWAVMELPAIHVCQPTHSSELAELLLNALIV